MSQNVLPFQYEAQSQETGMTGLGGLPLYLDLMHRMGMRESISEHIDGRRDSQGFSDSEMIQSLMLLNLAGGDCVDDLEILEADQGFRRLLTRVRTHGLNRKERRERERRWRKEQKRSVPSPTAVFRYLSLFHDPEQEKLRLDGKAFIPAPNEYLGGFPSVCRDMVSFAQQQDLQETATLDMDATLVESHKAEAFYCYKKFPGYQPFNVWWAQQEMILHTEFRDGNVSAGYEQLRMLKEALALLPEGVEKVRLRSDTAGYQHDLLRYCEMEENERFGRIEFAIGCDVTPAFKDAVLGVADEDWHPINQEANDRREETGRQWAEVCFVPNAIGHSKKGPAYRYLATREVIHQQVLPGMEDAISLPFPVVAMERERYKVHGIVTNMDWNGLELIDWLHKRCGKSEEAHAVMKDDLAGGKLPSGDFGENAAWWWIMILSFNLNVIMKRQVLGKEWSPKRMKAMRFHLIHLAGRVVKRSRQLFVQISGGHPSIRLLLKAREKIACLVPIPAG